MLDLYNLFAHLEDLDEQEHNFFADSLRITPGLALQNTVLDQSLVGRVDNRVVLFQSRAACVGLARCEYRGGGRSVRLQPLARQ